jgi:arylsulfatase A-like enzyme
MKHNVVVICADSFRWDNLTVHGGTTVQTPVLDNLATVSHVFENAYTGSFPTAPHRCDVFTGRYHFTNGGWGPMPVELPTLAGAVVAGGAQAHLEIDCPNMIKENFFYQRGFTSWNWNRGQENDLLAPLSFAKTFTIPGDMDKYRKEPHNPIHSLIQYKANKAVRKIEKDEDYYMAVTARNAADAISKMTDQQFFLWVDMFDPHEPFDPPKHYFDLYYPEFDGILYRSPCYGRQRKYTQEELRAIQAAYWGEVTMVDRWVGHILDQLKVSGLDEKTVVIFTSDHGYALGDNDGFTGKNTFQLYNCLARIPLLVSLPRMRANNSGSRSAHLVQPVDITPTVLEAMGIAPADGMTLDGTSLLPIVEGEKPEIRDVSVTGTYAQKKPGTTQLGNNLRINTAEYSLLFPPKVDGSPQPQALLYELSDLKEENDIIEDNMDVAMALYERYREFYDKHNRTGEELTLLSPEACKGNPPTPDLP